MKRLQFTVVALSTLIGVGLNAQNVKGNLVQWSIASGGNGHYYEFVNQCSTWPDAKVAAESMTYLGITGHLVTITSTEENDFVFQNVLDPSAFQIGAWIGLTDNEAFGGYESYDQPNPKIDGWVWVTGEPVSFTDWGSFENSEGEHVEEPNNSGSNEDYAVMHAYTGSLAWNDQSDYYEPPFIVEFDIVPEPSTLILLSMAVIGLLGYAWHRRQD